MNKNENKEMWINRVNDDYDEMLLIKLIKTLKML